MQPRAIQLLEHIQDAAEFVLRLTKGKDIADYCNERALRDAVERNFITIGEAINELSKQAPETVVRIEGHAQIVAFWNVLVHVYEMIEDTQVWEIIHHDLPRLLDQVGKLLQQDTQ